MLPPHIPVVKLGTDVYPSLGNITTKNFNVIFSNIEADLESWSHLCHSVWTRVSIINMDILPQMNFFSSTLPNTSSHQLLGQDTFTSLQIHSSGQDVYLAMPQIWGWSFCPKFQPLFFVVCILSPLNMVPPQCISLLEACGGGSPFPTGFKIWFTLLNHLNDLSYV